MTTKEEQDMLTISQAAKEFGVKPETLRQAVKRGKLASETRFGVKVVSRRAVKGWLHDPTKHQRGNPNFR